MKFKIVDLDSLRVRVLVENSVPMGYGLRGLHGLSMLIETSREGRSANILFDVGPDPDIVLGNMEALNISPTCVDTIVLSHNHGDHARALQAVVEKTSKRPLPVVVHPAFFRLVFYNKPHLRIASNFAATRHDIERAGAVFMPVSEPFEVCEGLFTSGHVERVTGEPTGVATKILDQDGTWRQDPVDDDQCLLARVKDYGLVVITGCSHSGIVNILKHSLKITGESRIAAVIGGFHLTGASPERISNTIEEMKNAGVRFLASGHCTGFDAEVAMREAFGTGYRHLSVASEFRFPST